MTDVDTERLRELAEKATPGEWHASEILGEPGARVVTVGDYSLIATDPQGYPVWSERDAAYVAAANPQTILALLDRLAAAEALLRDIDRWDGFDPSNPQMTGAELDALRESIDRRLFQFLEGAEKP